MHIDVEGEVPSPYVSVVFVRQLACGVDRGHGGVLRPVFVSLSPYVITSRTLRR